MICPNCGAEYRRGFTVCRDCDVALAEDDAAKLAVRRAEGGAEREAAAAPGDPDEDPFCSFWKGTDLRVCTEICTVLDEAGIPHKTIRRQDHLFNLNNQTPYEVGVPASLYEKAELAIKDAFGTGEGTGEDAVYLLPPPEEDPRARKLRSVWVGKNVYACADQCRKLKKAGIYYRVDEKKHATVRKVEARYEIAVAEANYEQAIEVTGGVHSTVDEEDERAESGENEYVFDDEGDGSPAPSPTKRIGDEDWYPENATSLVWEGEPADSRSMIEMSMKEYDIRMRWEMQEGKPQLFVLPENEERAKEIIHEIVDDAPMN